MERSTQKIITFLGCPISAPITAVLRRWCQAVKPDLYLPTGDPVLRWTRPESLHITLHYLGSTVKSEVALHQAAIGEVTHTARQIPFQLKAPTPFPQSSRARGLWVPVEDPTESLSQLHSALGLKLQQLGLPVDRKPFRPHVTLGRISSKLRGAQRREAASALQRIVATRIISVAADSIDQIHWYQSVQQPGGNVYTPLATWPLGTS